MPPQSLDDCEGAGCCSPEWSVVVECSTWYRERERNRERGTKADNEREANRGRLRDIEREAQRQTMRGRQTEAD